MMHKSEVSRRTLLKGGAGIISATVADQITGFAYEAAEMRDYPEAEVNINPNTDRVILVVGGLGNDGIQIARGMNPSLSDIGSVIGVRYAQTNVHAQPITNLITKTLEDSGLQDRPVDAYLNSAAGMIMAKPLEQLAFQNQLGTVVFDCSPHAASDVKGMEGGLVRYHADVLDHSRLFTWISRFVSEQQQPSATLHDQSVLQKYAAANRNAIVTADAITLGMEAAALRTEINPGALNGVAERFVFMQSTGVDPLIDSARAYNGWLNICGDVQLVVDPYRPVNSHAIGNDFPMGVAKALMAVK